MEVEKKEKSNNVIQETKEFLDTFQEKQGEEEKQKEEQTIKFSHKFHEKYGFLSNLYECKIMIDNLQFKSVEHYYQAMKFEGTKKFEVIRRTGKSIEAHKLAQKKDTPKNRDWKDMKIVYMRKAIQAKFDQNENIRQQLIDTYPKDLIDVTPGDNFWGIGDKNDGKNMNAKILISIRDKYIQDKNENMQQ